MKTIFITHITTFLTTASRADGSGGKTITYSGVWLDQGAFTANYLVSINLGVRRQDSVADPQL